MFDDYILMIPREVFLRGDPGTKQQDITALCCVLEVGLDEETWAILERLQREFGNLSCESESCILSTDEIVERNILAMSGQDQILQEFFETKGVYSAHMLPTDPAVSVRRGPVHPCLNYDVYLDHYDVLKAPKGW